MHTETDDAIAQLERRHREATAELQAANAELRAFAYSVSHGLRAPLRAMRGFAEALQEDYGDRLDAVGRDYTVRIVAASERLDAMIKDLLDYSRVGRDRLELTPLAVDELLADVPGLAALNAAESRPEVHVEPSELVLMAHRPTLSRVVDNLVSNAVKFVPAGVTPRIEVRARAVGDGVRVEVVDQGIGIAPEHIERVFGVFERLHTRDAFPGTGIGLAIVRRAVERQGGTVGVESAPGEGSTFWFQMRRAP